MRLRIHNFTFGTFDKQSTIFIWCELLTLTVALVLRRGVCQGNLARVEVVLVVIMRMVVVVSVVASSGGVGVENLQHHDSKFVHFSCHIVRKLLY